MATSENTPVSSSITIEQHGRVGSSGTAKSGENMDYVSQENKNVSLDDIGSEKSEYLNHRILEAELRLIELERKISELQSQPNRRQRTTGSSTPDSTNSGASTPFLPEEDYDFSPALQACENGPPRFVTKQFNQSRRNFEEKPTDENDVLAKEPPLTVENPFTWKQVILRNGDERADITINCPTLKQMIAQELKDWPGHYEPRIRFSSPFPEVIHNWDRLRKAALEALPNGSCHAHLNQLLDDIEKSKILRYYFQQRGHEADRMVSYGDLDKLFYPGQLVFATPCNVPQVFLVHEGRYRIHREETEMRRVFELLCWTYDFDGTQFTRMPYHFLIKFFPKTKRIDSLRCYPLDYHENKTKIISDLVKRGEKFRDACIQRTRNGFQMFDYDGTVYFTSKRPEDIFGEQYAGQVVMGAIIAGAVERHREERLRDDMSQAELESQRSKVFTYKGRVMVDPGAYRLYGPEWGPRTQEERPERWKECDCSKCQKNEDLRKRLKTHYDNFKQLPNGQWKEFEQEQLLICPPRVQGYALTKKLFVEFEVEKISEIPAEKRTNDKAFSELVLPDTGEWKDAKDVIRSLVQYHTTKELPTGTGVPGKLEDLVKGKGQGLVILLHGASGVGKTLTAESVAEVTGKPLYKVSLADIGTEITRVEKNLEDIFQLASRWEAVLLFDEADVLLEARSDEAQLQRNALVSVFLKVLEYYEGILLLTTNRIRTFDYAVQSRVHFSIRFLQMQEEDQKELLRTFLKQIHPRDMEKDDIQRWIKSSFMDNKFSGRQIRNILSSAMILARAEGRKLSVEDITKLWKKTKEFNDVLAAQRIIAEHNSGLSKERI